MLSHQIRRLADATGPADAPDRLLLLWGSADFPDGSDDAPAIDQLAWMGIHQRLTNAALESGVVKPMAAIEALTRDSRADDPVPIAIADFEVKLPSADLRELIGAAAAHGNALRFEIDREHGLESLRVFAATGWLHDQWQRMPPVHRGREVTFVLDRALYLRGPEAPWPDAIEADLGDGWRPVRFDEPFGPCSGDDAARLTLRCRYGQEVRVARLVVPLSDGPAPPEPDETWPILSAGGAGGRAWVFRGARHEKVVNPLIIVEGFPGNRPYDYTYELLNQHGMVDRLRKERYDLIIVGLDNGLLPIETNAAVLEACIARARKATCQPLVVGGLSMGGVISRYALADLETRGIPHGTRAYVSIDAPHRGTYTSLGVQWFVHTLAPFAPALEGFADLLDSSSNQQLLMHWLHAGKVETSPQRTALLQAMDAVGTYARQPRKLAIACGRGDGVGVDVSAGDMTLQWDGEPFGSLTTRTLPGAGGVVAEGTWLMADPPALPPLRAFDTPPWEGVPGSVNMYNAQVAQFARAVGCGRVADGNPRTCGIPTRSALDLDVDTDPFAAVGDAEGPFDAHTCSEDSVEHLSLTEQVTDWLVGELGPAPADGVGQWNPYGFDPRDPEFLDDPYPTYAQFREIDPDFFVTQFASRWFFGYEECRTILERPELFAKANPDGSRPMPGPIGILNVFGEPLFSADPSRHTELRGAFAPVFRQCLGEAADAAREVAVGLRERLAVLGRMELVADYATPVPAAAMFAMVGIPEDVTVRNAVLGWVTQMVAAHDRAQPLTVQAAGATSRMALQVYLQGLLVQYEREGNGPGLLGHMARHRRNLTAEDVYTSCVDFVLAGYLSTTWLVASAIHRLRPDEIDALRRDRSKVPRVLKEVLRLEAPVQLIDRFVTEDDVTLGAALLRRGDKVTAVIGSANRDPRRFDVPDDLDLAGDDNGHLSFGDGIHRCIGEPLAMAVAPIMLNELLEFDDLEADGYAQWQADPYLRGLVNLPVRI